MAVNKDARTILETAGLFISIILMLLFLLIGMATFNDTLITLAVVCLIGAVVFSLSGKPLIQPD